MFGRWGLSFFIFFNAGLAWFARSVRPHNRYYTIFCAIIFHEFRAIPIVANYDFRAVKAWLGRWIGLFGPLWTPLSSAVCLFSVEPNTTCLLTAEPTEPAHFSTQSAQRLRRLNHVEASLHDVRVDEEQHP